MTVDLDREMERELHRILDPVAAAPVPARRPAPGGSSNPAKKLLGGAGAALGLKALTGFAIAAMAAGAATEAAITGSFNPADWGHQARHQVTSVSNQHGTAVGDQQSTQAAPGNASQSSTTDAGSTAGSTAGDPARNATGSTDGGTIQTGGGQGGGAPKGGSPKINAGTEPEPTDPGMHHGPMPIGPET